MIQAVLWDNDGVLVDSESLFFEATRSAFARAGLSLTREMWGTRYLGEGKTSREIALSLGADPDRIELIIDNRNQQYRKVIESRPPDLRPRVRETLSKLSGRIKMAIVTGCRREQLHLMHLGNDVLAFFDTVVTGDDCTFSKPHPAPYLAAIKALGVNPGDCIAVEDSPKGFASAKAAGVPCIVVPTGLTRFLEFEDALSVEQDVSGVLKYIGNHQNSHD